MPPTDDIPSASLQAPAGMDRIRRSSLHVAAARLIGMLVSIYILRALAVEEFGLYSKFTSLLLYFSFFANLGVQGSLQRYVPEYHAKRQFLRIHRTYGVAAGLNLALAALALGAAFLFFDPLGRFLHLEGHESLFCLFALGAVSLFQFSLLSVVLNSVFLHAFATWGQLGFVLLKGAFVVGLLRAGLGVKGLLLADIFGCFPVFLILLWLYARWSRPRRAASDREGQGIECKRLSRYSAYNCLSTPGGILYDYGTDIILIGHYLTDHLVGVYAFATRVSRMLTQLLPQELLQTVVRPAFYSRHAAAEQKTRALDEMFNGLCRLNFFFLAPLLVFVIVGGQRMIGDVFEPKYLPAYVPLVGTFFFLFATFFDLPSDLVIQAIEKIQYRFYAQVFAVYNLVMVVVALKAGWGIEGVVLVTGTALLMRSLFMVYFAVKLSGVRFNGAGYTKTLINALMMGIVLFLVLRHVDGLLGLLAACGAGGATYLAASLLLFPFTDDERERFRRFFRFVPRAKR
jgi:O-antigen/teichoic acid export membrane protein